VRPDDTIRRHRAPGVGPLSDQEREEIAPPAQLTPAARAPPRRLPERIEDPDCRRDAARPCQPSPEHTEAVGTLIEKRLPILSTSKDHEVATSQACPFSRENVASFYEKQERTYPTPRSWAG
jgi:hypothetical protein